MKQQTKEVQVVFASSWLSCFLSIWHADSLHCALFTFQWSLFLLFNPQFVMGKQIDIGWRKAQNKHEAYESLHLMIAGEKGQTMLWSTQRRNYTTPHFLWRPVAHWDVQQVFKGVCLPTVCKQIHKDSWVQENKHSYRCLWEWTLLKWQPGTVAFLNTYCKPHHFKAHVDH